MEAFLTMLNAQITLVVYMAAGFLCKKVHIITTENQSKLSDLVLKIAMPCLIYSSFDQALTSELMKDVLLVIAISFATYFISWLCGKLLYNRYPEAKRNIMQYATLVNNAAFAGLPLAVAMYGELGLFYASIYLIPLRVFMWTAGVSIFTDKTDKRQAMKNVLLNPCIIVVFIGFARMLTGFELPEPIDKGVVSIGNMATPLSLMIVGAVLADIDVRKIMEKGILPLTIVRLVLLPLLVIGALRLLQIDPTVTGICVMLTAMPAGTTTVLLASRYQADIHFASKSIFVTTILSLITVPLLMLLL